MRVNLQEKSIFYKAGFLLLAILFCTYARVTLLFLYPVLVVGLYYIFNWKLDKNAMILLAVVGVCWILSFRNGFYLTYNIISFYFFLPFILLLFAVPQKNIPAFDYLKMFMWSLTFIVVINDIAGIIQYIIQQGDDRFVGIYGIFTVSQNGLSLVNGILFFYHLSAFQKDKKRVNIIFACFFILCCVMGFYGAGQMLLIATLVLTFLRFQKKNIVQLLVISCITLTSVILLMKLISPRTYDYNVAIVKKFVAPDPHDIPRKLISFRNYFQGYSAHPADMLFGSGPGTYNSRTAFMVGSPTYFNLSFIKNEHKPYYFWNYAYPLWNSTNTGPYDGFMNQPFATILALLGEYGLTFSLLLLVTLIYKFHRLNTLANKPGAADISVEKKMYRFCSIFAFLLIIIDNYMEYPEIIGLIIIIIKLSELQLRRSFDRPILQS